MSGYIYLIKNLKDNYYLGSTNDYKRRILEHNTGKHKITRKQGPWKFEHIWKVSSLKNARKLEYYIKSWKTKLVVENINKAINHFLNKGS